MKSILSMALLALAAVSLIAPAAGADGYRHVSMQKALGLMQTESDYIILDVRTHEEYNDGHIPGAVCVPNETIFHDQIPELPDKDQLILVYCRSGNRSRQASAKLAALGYTNIVEIGGIHAWPGELNVP